MIANIPVSVSSPVTAILYSQGLQHKLSPSESPLWLKCYHSQQWGCVCNLQLEALTSAWHHWPPDVNRMVCSLLDTALWVRGSVICLGEGIFFSWSGAQHWRNRLLEDRQRRRTWFWLICQTLFTVQTVLCEPEVTFDNTLCTFSAMITLIKVRANMVLSPQCTQPLFLNLLHINTSHYYE